MKTVWARESHQESKQPLGIENTTFHLLGGGGGGTAAAAADKSVNVVEAEEGHVKTLDQYKKRCLTWDILSSLQIENEPDFFAIFFMKVFSEECRVGL